MKMEIDSADVVAAAGLFTVLGAAFAWLWARLSGAFAIERGESASRHKADATLAAEVVAPLLTRIQVLERQVEDERKRSQLLERLVRLLMGRVEKLRIKAKLPAEQWHAEEKAAILIALGDDPASFEGLPDEMAGELRRGGEGETP